MPQSLAAIHLHTVFSTKNRERWIPREVQSALHEYLGGILKNTDCLPVQIHAEPDHVHLLFKLGRTISIAELVGHLKQGSTLWLREQSGVFHGFHWQSGYGVFSVSSSNVDAVRQYIRNQEEHHRVKSFQQEYRDFLQRHGLDWDERYVWD